MNPFDLSGKTILVTGASSGIGRASAELIAELGGTLVLSARRAEALEETRRALAGEGHRVIAGDLSDAAFREKLVTEAGPLDGLVHAAGVCPAVPLAVAELADITSALEVNYIAFMDLMRFYAKPAWSREGFSSVAVSSVSAEAGWAGGSLYAGGKGALAAAVKSLAVELAPRARVNAVLPGNTRTPLFESLAGEICDEEGLEKLIARQPLGLGEPDQIAGPIAFLLSDAASFVTGVALPVDGGYLAQ